MDVNKNFEAPRLGTVVRNVYLRARSWTLNASEREECDRSIDDVWPLRGGTVMIEPPERCQTTGPSWSFRPSCHGEQCR
jgi:hypothetical protein